MLPALDTTHFTPSWPPKPLSHATLYCCVRVTATLLRAPPLLRSLIPKHAGLSHFRVKTRAPLPRLSRRTIHTNTMVAAPLPSASNTAQVLRNTFSSYKVFDAAGNGIKFQAGVNPLEGMTLHNHIKRNRYRYCCEIGCAYGTSAQYMCQAFKDLGFTGQQAQLVSVDPYQDTQWKGIGALNVKRAGLGEFHRVVQMKDFLALPMLLSEIVGGSQRERYGREHILLTSETRERKPRAKRVLSCWRVKSASEACISC